MSVKHALLGLLAQRPRHGYELHQAFEALVGGKDNWEVKPAQVYTTLARLEKGGLVVQESVEQEGGPEKVIYRLTGDGLAELQAWLAAPVQTRHQRDAFYLKLMIALACDGAPPTRLIYAQRASLFQELHDLTAQRTAADPGSELAYILLMNHAWKRFATSPCPNPRFAVAAARPRATTVPPIPRRENRQPAVDHLSPA
jgi:DNA-binding PadR family transcriptional regulator